MPQFCTLQDTAEMIQNSATVALGGITLYRRPVAFVRELLRRENRPRDLSLLCFTAGFESDLLVGAGCVTVVRSAYFGLEAFGFAPMFTQAAQQGDIKIIEETEASLALGIRAKMSGVEFLPSHAWIGTDLPALRPDVKQISDPYTNEMLMAFPAISCDVAVIHGLKADRAGNVKLNNNLGVDLELIYIAETVIFTVEEIVEQLTPSSDGIIIPAPGIDVIAHTPRGAYPTSCYPLYPIGGSELLRYVDACTAGQFETYLAEFVLGESSG